VTDPRLTAYLEVARERPHPFYAAGAYRLAYEAGDTAAMEEAVRHGALSWRPEPVVRMRGEGRAKVTRGAIVQLRLFDEAA
jgi:hypothetical protein